MHDYLDPRDHGDPGDYGDRYDFLSPEYDRESRRVQGRQAESRAELQAMPIRLVTSYNPMNGFMFLECGHAVPLPETMARAEDMIGDRIRCRKCYELGLQAARRMVGTTSG